MKRSPLPFAVRYGWADNPVCKLYNRDGLPVATLLTGTGLP